VLDLAEPREVLLLSRLGELREQLRVLRGEGDLRGERPASRLELLLHPGDDLLELGDLEVHARPRLDAHRVGVVDERGLLRLERGQPLDRRVELRRDAVELDPLPGRRLVEEVEGAVGQRAVGDVALREADGLTDRRVADLDVVDRLEAVRDAAEDLDRLLRRGRLDREHREAP